ncbi:MAG TPA: protein kinase [Polyangiaceae bacterium]
MSDAGLGLSSEPLVRGGALGRYELLVPIAVGGMARVWAARLHGQRGFTKLVAIKTVLPHLACDPEFERMLVDEAQIASGVRHPNVCEIYELGEESTVVYIAMEWVHGDSLRQILKASGAVAPHLTTSRAVTPHLTTSSAVAPLDPRVAARIVADSAAGLHAAHNLTDEDGRSLEVVHRDVSPHNILVSLDGNVKVADFGVAKAIGASHEATRAGQLKGKLAYMAPEQASGSPVDRRSDVFSLGCVLYEATTGKQPFRGEGEHQIIRELIKGSFPPPSRVVRNYPYDLERIVLRAMAAQPLHRYPTMEQMRLELEEWLAKSGPVVTQSNVAAVVRERVGGEVDKRKERIRVATNAIAEEGGGGQRRSHPPAEPTQLTPSGSPERRITPSGIVASGSIPPPGRVSHSSLQEIPTGGAFHPTPVSMSQAPTGPQYVTAAAMGVMAAAALGAVGFWVWSSMRTLPPPAPPPAVVATVATAPVLPSPEPVPPTTGVVLAAPPVAFTVTPPHAFLVIDGTPLEPAVRTIPRPPAGATETIIVRADGYADRELHIDDSVTEPIEVALTAQTGGPSKGSAPEPAPPGPN